MPQIFGPPANSIARVVLLSILIVPIPAIGLGYAVMRSQYITDASITRDQPVPFSHEHHVTGLGLDCRYCHSSVERSAIAGVPPTETCMTCHSQLYTQAQMLEPVRASLAENRPIHWQRVNVIPEYVYFDHAIHIAKGVGCTTCHGPVGTMPLMRQAQSLTMGWCLNCHRDPTPYLRELSAVFDPDWKPPAQQEEDGKKRLIAYHINNEHLTDCSVCHR
jgi:Cytochrome c7 and related cytochrome c